MKCAKPGSERVGEKVSGAAREKELCHCSTARKKKKIQKSSRFKKKLFETVFSMTAHTFKLYNLI